MFHSVSVVDQKVPSCAITAVAPDLAVWWQTLDGKTPLFQDVGTVGNPHLGTPQIIRVPIDSQNH